MEESTGENLDQYRRATFFLDSDAPEVVDFSRRAVGDAETEREKAVRLYFAVRDGIQYDPYRIEFTPAAFKASTIIKKGYGYCVAKAIVLCAAARAQGLASRLRFADVRNHLTTERLRRLMKTDLFIFHGYSEFYLQSRWLKATPTFNISLCERFGVKPLDFDGESDAVFHPFDRAGRKHMEYVFDHGPFADVPYETIVAMFSVHYGAYFTMDKSAVEGLFEKEASPGPP